LSSRTLENRPSVDLWCFSPGLWAGTRKRDNPTLGAWRVQVPRVGLAYFESSWDSEERQENRSSGSGLSKSRGSGCTFSSPGLGARTPKRGNPTLGVSRAQVSGAGFGLRTDRKLGLGKPDPRGLDSPGPGSLGGPELRFPSLSRGFAVWAQGSPLARIRVPGLQKGIDSIPSSPDPTSRTQKRY
jgi:hypothetical protein